MSYNGSGTYIPPAGQPVATGTVIQSNTFNTLVTDIGNTLNNVLPRDGQASMSGQLKITDGTSGVPGIAFNSEASTGMFRPTTGTLAFVASGVENLRINNTGRVLIGTTTDDGTNKLQVNGSAKFSGAVTLASTLNVAGVTTLSSTLNVTGAATLGSVTTSGAATVGTTLGVTGATTLSSTLGVTSNATVGGTLSVTGVTSLSSVTTSGAATVGTTLGVTGATTLASTLSVTGNVGVGITTPANKLHVIGNASLGATTAVAGAYQALTFNAGVYNKAQIRGYSLSTIDAGALAFLTAPDSDVLYERMRVDSNGNVGIGITSPTQALDVRNSTGGNITAGRTANVAASSEPGT